MTPRPLIFISAVSQELRSARQLVANTLTFLGYQPVWQEIFATEGGDLRELLRRQISQCKGVVQLVGKCYGAEPAAPDPKFGRVSFTQYEALFGRESGKKVWYLFIDEQFPSDPYEAEPEEIQLLQATYRRSVQSDTHLFHPLASREALEASVLRLRDDLGQLRRRVTQWAAAVAALLILILGLIIWQLRQAAVARAEMAKFQRGIKEYVATEVKVINRSDGEQKAVIEERVYEEIAQKIGVDPKVLREKLPAIATELKQAPNASNFDRANAAYVANDYAEAEELAVKAADEAREGGPEHSRRVIKALTLAGLAAENAIQYASAQAHYREAEKLTDVNRDAEEWASLQDSIAGLLFAEGKYSEAETLFHRVIEVRTRVLGPEHPETLTSRHRLIYALTEEAKHAEAETEARQVVALREKNLGSEHPDTLVSRYNLANALLHEGKNAEAEPIYRQVIELDSKVIGPENRRTLAARIGLANVLTSEGRSLEAEAMYREVIKADLKVYGPNHPVTLNDRNDLATVLQAAGKYESAATEYQSVIRGQEKSLGPEHGDTLNSHNNFAELLDDQGKYVEAEAECRRILEPEEKSLGAEHRQTLNTRGNLAVALIGQGRIDEALPECVEVLKLMERKLGAGYSDTQDFTVKFAKGLAKQHRVADAIQLLTDAQERARQNLGPDHPLIQKYGQFADELRNGKQ